MEPVTDGTKTRRRFPTWAKVVIAIFAIGGVVSIVSPEPDAPAVPAAAGMSTDVTSPPEVICVDSEAAAALSQDAIGEFTDGTKAISNYDVTGAADHLENAGALFTEVAAILSPEPTISVPTQLAATAILDSAQALRDGDFAEATRLIGRATTYIKTATRGIGTSGVVSC